MTHSFLNMHNHFSAHEITHAFDDEGINYDSQGSVGNLYDTNTIQAFHAEADCLRQQYSQYKLQGTDQYSQYKPQGTAVLTVQATRY
jgi:predicted metalloendopeptidase